MAEETFRFPKGVLHSEARHADDDPDRERGHNYPTQTCEERDWQLVWPEVINTSGMNAEMFIRSKHTSTEWVFVFDKEREDDPKTPGAETEGGGKPTTGDQRNKRPKGKEPVPATRTAEEV